MPVLNSDGSKRFIGEVSGDYQESDITGMGATQVQYRATTNTVLADSFDPTFETRVEDGENDNILKVGEDLAEDDEYEVPADLRPNIPSDIASWTYPDIFS